MFFFTLLQRQKKYLLVVFLLTFLGQLFLTSDITQAADPPPPFQPGEKFTYKAKWGRIAAGDVTIEVLPWETVNGVKAYHFVMVTKTNSVVDLAYKIRERQDSYVTADLAHSILYKKRTEGKYPRDVIVNFDWDKREATRSNFGEKMAPITIVPGTFDPLALFFVIRLQNLKENSMFEIPITDGDSNILVQATVTKREKIQLYGKTYDAFEVIPNMERLISDKVVKKSDNPELKIWFSADDKKIPVKIRSKARVGYFDFDLVSVAPP